MGSGETGKTARAVADASTVELFQQDWMLYRKLVDNNFLFHREAYGALRGFLTDGGGPLFRFLDIACGDASASAAALRGTRIAHYHGIDFSAAALELAEQNLKNLGCPVTLAQCDFLDALAAGIKPVDIAWIGLSLHHLHAPEKLTAMHRIHDGLAPRGRLLIYENTSPDGEDRKNWLRRWDLQKPAWTAYSEQEWDAMAAHVHAADFPETDSIWRALGHEAGFAEVHELYRAPTDLFRLYCFSA